ncbi:hypothetical protein J3L16_06325 [Alteromonas sp. 5E99-2]|uniref:hypothetical protein n=1 Tax=Alteromonas sp. 5E99-2 TaxID=2817683 RepID=UPI001A9A262D|nr:hypothetical protein [Alteromonas sp. 5E99-2]MBO1255301.1 hypothetical protein [Alteromonas sp. 5E99-2]
MAIFLLCSMLNAMTSINSTHVDKQSEAPRKIGTSLTLHSDYTVIKRVLHITCLIGILYALSFASFQFSSLEELVHSQHSALGTTANRYDTEKNYATLFAEQWGAAAFQDPIEKDTLIQIWSTLPAVKFIAVYSETGHLIRQAPQDTSLKETRKALPNALVTSALLDEKTSKGMLIMLIDESSFESIAATHKQLLLKGVLACLFIGVVIGSYLFRGFRYFRPKTRK